MRATFSRPSPSTVTLEDSLIVLGKAFEDHPVQPFIGVRRPA